MLSLLAGLFVGCAGDDSPKDDTSAPIGDSGADTSESPFDSSCAAQLMATQEVGTTGTLEIDFAGLSADSAGAPFTLADVRIVHWYILGMPPSTLGARLCSDTDLTVDVLDGNAALPPSDGTTTTLDIGTEWSYQLGVIALYDTLDENAPVDPRAAAVFTFAADNPNQRVVFEGRGDVWTGP